MIAVGLLPIQLSAELQLAQPTVKTDSFDKNIQRVFADDQLADVRVIFGYDNNKDYMSPSDPVRARNLMAYLTRKSFKNIEITEDLAANLGVTVNAQNLRVFEGPGLPGQTLRVSLIWSSATLSTAKNVGSERALQYRCSYEALKFMQKAASDAEVHVYLGHSRAGGGPDTFPPVTLNNIAGDRQQVDYSHYRAQPGLKALESYFLKSKATPYFILWTSCATERHFRSWFSRVLSTKRLPTNLVLSTRITEHIPEQDQIEGRDEGLMVVIRLLEALQKHESRHAFEERIKTCEMEFRHDPLKPAWKLIALPGDRTAR